MKRTAASMVVLVLIAIFAVNVYAGENDGIFDTGRVSDGVIGIAYSGEESTRYKVMISKDNEKYYYDYSATDKEYFPLQFGSGYYQVSVLGKVSGNTYRLLFNKVIKVEMGFENSVYLQSVQNINWNSDMDSIKKAAELTYGLTDTAEKVKAIYEYIILNIDYDYNKVNNLEQNYVPDIEDTFSKGKGICYDYASLFASMLRSQGIPTKLVKGYSSNVKGYHAWNEVFMDGEWVVADTAFDAAIRYFNSDISFEKNRNEYEVVKVY